MFLCVIPVLCLWALLPELKLMMMVAPKSGTKTKYCEMIEPSWGLIFTSL